MILVASDLPKLDAVIDESIRSRAAGMGINFRNAMLLVAGEWPDLFRAVAALRSGRMAEVSVPYLLSGNVLLRDYRPRGVPSLEEARNRIDEEIAIIRASDSKLSYGSAWRIVAREKPDLIGDYNEAAKRTGVYRTRFQ